MGKIKVKLVVFGENYIESEIIKDESLQSAVDRSLSEVPLGERKSSEIFTALVDGKIIKPEMWESTKLTETNNVFLAPTIRSDDSGSILRGALQIAIIAVAYAYLGPGGTWATGWTPLMSGLAVAGASMAGSLLLNALIPPSVPKSGALFGDGELSDSQMYSVTGQSNQLKRFGRVPKVYGQHTIFPNIAANPYIEIEQVEEGKFVQYLYAIYDLGFGPGYVHSIKIGDSPVENYTDVEYRIVDPNKPAISEGEWDDQSVSDFTYYKGQVDSESASVVLNGNESVVGSPQESYYLERSLSSNPELLSQKYTLQFVLPGGLYSVSANGDKGSATIGMEIQFAPVGTTDWKSINDPIYTTDFKSAGGFSEYESETAQLFPGVLNEYTLLNTSGQKGINLYATDAEINGASLPAKTGNLFQAYVTDWGFLKGTYPSIQLKNTNTNLFISRALRSTISMRAFDDLLFQKVTPGDVPPVSTYLGKISAIVGGISPQYSIYTTDKLTDYNIPIIRRAQGTLNSIPPRNITRWSTDSGGIGVPNESEYMNAILIDKSVDGKIKIQRSENVIQYASVSFTPKAPGEYKIRIIRKTTISQYGYQSVTGMTFSGIQTRTAKPPINTDKRHLFLEVKIRATNQLNGVIQNLSAVVTSALDVYDPDTQTWSKQLTSNPAWVYADLLTSEINKNAVVKTRLDVESLSEWADFCDEVPDNGTTGMIYDLPRFSSNFVLDYSTTLQGILSQVASAAQAGFNIVDGRYGVLIDKRRDTPKQLFTPRNSKDFSSTRVYTRRPHALKVQFIDAGAGYIQSEAIVYDDGYTAANATEFEPLTAFSCTNFQQAWRYGRYMIAQNRLRQETISITVDFENLVCTRGDYVQITQDVMRAGGFPGRVRSVTGNRVVMDNSIETLPAEDYGFSFRSVTGEIFTGPVEIINANTFDFSGSDFPQVGDLMVIGVIGEIVIDCIIKSIRPNADMSAQLTLVEKADPIYDAESTSDFPDYSPDINSTTLADYKPPGEVQNLQVIHNDYNIKGKAYENYIDLDWDAPTGSAYEKFEVYVDFGKGFSQVGIVRDSAYRYIVDPDNLDTEHAFKVIAVSVNGKKLELGFVSHVSATPLTKTSPPSNVVSFSCDTTNESMTLLWEKSLDLDILEYRIRFNPNSDMASWTRSSPLLRAEASVTNASVQTRAGTYLIKAVDFNGNESLTASAVITTIPNLFNLNFIETLNDGDTWPGNKTNTEVLVGTLISKQEIPNADPSLIKYFSESFYYFSDIVDLVGIYTVRAQANIDAIGFTEGDLIHNWVTLSSVLYMSSVRPTDWAVEAQYRSTTIFNVIHDWVTLSSISTMDVGASNIWTPFRNFTIGDITGLLFQFRLRLVSIRANVSARVISAVITVDTPDRIESYNSQEAISGVGKEILYSPVFLGPDPSPNVQVTIENGQAGDYYTFDYKTLEGFKVRFWNNSDVEVTRTFDAAVKGYGRRASQVI